MAVKVLSVVLALVLLVAPFAHAQNSCLVSQTLSSCTGLLCDLDVLIESLLSPLLCPFGLPLLQLNVTGGDYTLNLNVASLFGLNVNANGGSLTINLNSDLNVVQDVVLVGAAVLQTVTGAVVHVLGSLTVAADSLLMVAGNLTVSGSTMIYGTLQLAGTKTHGLNQNAWLVSQTVTFLGTPLSYAVLRGNGGIDGDVVAAGYVNLAAGNSPGIVVVSGGLICSSTTNVIIDVAGPNSFDVYIISRAFTRAGTLFLAFEDEYVPNPGDRFIWATHGSATGFFSSAGGNLTNIATAYGARWTSNIYDDPTGNGNFCSSYCSVVTDTN